MPEQISSGGHTVSVTLAGTWLKLEVHCHEPEGADCRMSCTINGCDDDSA